MDSSFGQPLYHPRSQRTFDGSSIATTTLGVALKQVDMPCPFHPEEQSSNYCIESKCYQPLCSQCIQDHLLHHKKHGYSDLGIKSLRGTRKQCISKLGSLIDELIRRLGMFQAPIPPEQQLEILDNKIETIRQKTHEIVQTEFARLRDSLRLVMNQSVSYYKSMAQIHSKLENLIEQIKETHSTLIDGGRKGLGVADCIKKTLTLDTEALLDTFQKEGRQYEIRRAKADLQVLFNPQILKECMTEVVKIINPQQNTSSSIISNKNQGSDEMLPSSAVPRGNGKLLHFFETGSNKLHLVSVETKKKGYERIIPISEFIVPSFHASVMSDNGQFIFLSGGIIELNGGSKSPLFIRYSVRTQSCKKDYAKVRPRSSHSLCEDQKGDIYILGGYGPSQLLGGDPTYEMTVERVNPRSGKVELEAESTWGGSNISTFFNGYILKACQEGIELYNQKHKQWVIAEIRIKSKLEYTFFKSTGFACLNDTDVMIFGGYFTDSTSSNLCFLLKINAGDRPKANVFSLNCKLPDPQGFESCCALVDEDGIFALQNIEDEQDTCLESERKLLRFSLSQQSWSVLQVLEE